jgi:hypothetical protein
MIELVEVMPKIPQVHPIVGCLHVAYPISSRDIALLTQAEFLASQLGGYLDSSLGRQS